MDDASPMSQQRRSPMHGHGNVMGNVYEAMNQPGAAVNQTP